MIKTVPIPLANGRTGWLHAGPTHELPEGYGLIACAKEIRVPEDRIAYDVRTKDFCTFDNTKLQLTLYDILRDLEDGQPLYVGCMGGTGRTGTLLAILVAQHPAFTGAMAINYIRQVYKPGAVETEAQEQQVEDYEGMTVPAVDHAEGWLREPPTEVAPSKRPQGFLQWLFGRS